MEDKKDCTLALLLLRERCLSININIGGMNNVKGIGAGFGVWCLIKNTDALKTGWIIDKEAIFNNLEAMMYPIVFSLKDSGIVESATDQEVKLKMYCLSRTDAQFETYYEMLKEKAHRCVWVGYDHVETIWENMIKELPKLNEELSSISINHKGLYPAFLENIQSMRVGQRVLNCIELINKVVRTLAFCIEDFAPTAIIKPRGWSTLPTPGLFSGGLISEHYDKRYRQYAESMSPEGLSPSEETPLLAKLR